MTWLPNAPDFFCWKKCRLLEILLNTLLKIYPLSLPELRYLGNYSGSTSSSKFNTGKKMEEDNMEGPSSNKRQKGRKDKAASDKLNSDEKLKQSTILDAFKRAGVTITQETKKASSRPLPSGMTSKDVESEANNPGELGHIDLMAAPVQLDMQRFKFRTLHVNCLSLLKYSEVCICSVWLNSLILLKFYGQVLIYLFYSFKIQLIHIMNLRYLISTT